MRERKGDRRVGGRRRKGMKRKRRSREGEGEKTSLTQALA